MEPVGSFAECVGVIENIYAQRRRVEASKAEIRELVTATREMIAQSRAIMSEADRLIGRRVPLRIP